MGLLQSDAKMGNDNSDFSQEMPQSMQPPTQLNGNAMNNQVSAMKNNGMPTSQSVTKAANNPNNKFMAKGGVVTPPSKPELDTQLASSKFNQSDIDTYTKALQGEAGLPNASATPKAAPTPKAPATDSGDNQFKQYFTKEGKDMMADRAKMVADEPKGDYAKGGAVHKKGDMSLKQALLASKSMPMGQGQSTMDATNPMGSTQMKSGGAMMKPHMKSEATGNTGLLTMNDDAGGYAQGGDVDPNSSIGNDQADHEDTSGQDTDSTAENEAQESPPMLDDKDSGSQGLLKMATGGQMEADSITSYGPDGQPIVQNADGSSSEGDINQLLDRPEGANSLGTGEDPANATSDNAANSIGNGTSSNMMKDGGEEAPPPGSLKEEVADDVPAHLSQGEFVMSADTTRFYGLRLLTMLQDHAREQLAKMASEGDVRHPGDGKNPDQEGFHQDDAPNMNAYADKPPMDDSDEPDEITGLLKECQGGMNMATGGGLGEEQSLFKGGSVSSSGPSLTPKKFENGIPMGKSKLPGIKDPFNNTNKLPKMATGGLLSDRDTVPQQSIIGS